MKLKIQNWTKIINLLVERFAACLKVEVVLIKTLSTISKRGKPKNHKPWGCLDSGFHIKTMMKPIVKYGFFDINITKNAGIKY